jgi:hypothetical protein
LPTPWVAGNIDPQQELLIGGLMAWVLPEGSTTGMLEYKGQGLQPQENALLTDVKDMAARAASLLEVAPMVPETMTAMVTRTHGSESPIQSLIRNVSEGITQLLQWSAWWSGLTENPADPAIRYVLNTSLMGPIVESALLKTLMEMLLNNTISAQTWDYNLHRMEIARPGVSFEEEQDLIDLQKEAQPLAMPTRPGTPSPGGRNGATRVAA